MKYNNPLDKQNLAPLLTFTFKVSSSLKHFCYKTAETSVSPIYIYIYIYHQVRAHL